MKELVGDDVITRVGYINGAFVWIAGVNGCF